jgi:hypothetical protein
MTKLTPDHRCDSCGGLLIPPDVVPDRVVPDRTDYVCLTCGRPYRWVGNPPRLVTAPTKD